MNIKPGDLIQGPRWPEAVEVKLAEERGDYVQIVGVMVNSRKHVDQLLTKSEAENLIHAKLDTNLSASPRNVFLAIETIRYRFASLYDPLLAMNTSKVDPLPHQIEAVYGYVLKLPRIRFLIADDPGAGKTIMAGLAIKELKLRHLAKRILIVVPGHLKDQWRRELKERFEENFTVIDRGYMDALFGENVWEREMQIITSIDFAKQDDVLPSIASVHYDLIVIDEAHKMAAYKYGDKIDKTIRYRLGESLSNSTTHLLFLTATPHKGDPESFRLFLDLLEPGFFATSEMVAESIKNQDNPLFIRRVKEDMRDFEGRPLFLARHVDTKAFDLGKESPDEKDLYNDLSRYVNDQYNKALTKNKRRNIAFALVILQRRLASSTYALFKSLERRKERLVEMLLLADEPHPSAQQFDFDAIEDLSEEDRWEQEEIWETLSVAENRQELELEIVTLEKIIAQAKSIIQVGDEVKLRHLKDSLKELNDKYPGAKVLIFTEAKDTLEYLEKRIKEWGYSICTIQGGMKLEERIKAEDVFKHEAQILVATEAAGEGINLQFCNLMINYDLPWNPNRLEQRMGRIHRYGQTKEVYIFNLVASDTREGRVLFRLFEKLDEIKNALGSDKVFDVLGDVIHGKNLSQLLVEAAANSRNLDEILDELDVKVDPEYIAQVKENLGESLATRYIDYTRIKEMAEQAREHRLIPEYTEAFFQKAMDTSGGKWHRRWIKGKADGDEYLAVDSIPFKISQIADEDSFKKQHGYLHKRYPIITFDKEIAHRYQEVEFVSFGHPLFESILSWVERDLNSELQQGAVFTDPDGILDGTLLFYQGEIRDGNSDIAGSRIFSLFVDSSTGEISPVNSAILWDLLEEGSNGESPSDSLEDLKQKAFNILLPQLEDYKKELSEERERQGDIKEKYGVKSLEHLVWKFDGDLIGLYDRKEKGQNVDLVIFNKEEQKKGYEQALVNLKQNLSRERNLTLSTPRFLTAVQVVPAAVEVEEEMVSSEEIELIGMKVTMDFETKNKREPEDVSNQNLGFDVRSYDPKSQEKRHIEVKARAKVGPVSLTQNEWFKAVRFKDDYYLYVVLNAATNPKLYIIPNPAGSIEPEEKVEVRYMVGVKEITSKGVAA